MNLAIIIPALNEEGSVAETIGRLPPGLATRVIVVDNGSTDTTADRARSAGAEVVREPRRGYGRACLAGLARLGPAIEAVAILDADGADDPTRLPELVRLVETGSADLALSARRLGDARRNLSPQQRFGNWLACWLIGWLWGHRYQDLGPMRVLGRSALDRLAMSDPTWGWNVEMQIKAIERGLRVREVPVAYGARRAGHSKISGNLLGTLRAGTRILGTIAVYWWRRPARRPAGDARPAAVSAQPLE